MEDYRHIKCQCGGIIGMYNRDTFNCERCNKEYQLHKLNYDICLINDKTGWIFPMKLKQENKIMKTTNMKNTLNLEVIDATAKLTVSRGYVCRHCSTEIIEEARNRGGFRSRIAHNFRGDKGYGATCARCGGKGFFTLYEII